MNPPSRSTAACILLALAMAGAVGAASAPTTVGQTGRTVRTTDLRADATSASAMVKVIAANTEVVVHERRGGWYRIDAGTERGWIRLTAVRFATATPSSSGGLSSSLGFLRSGRSAAQGGTVTTGVRGLSETDLANSTPDEDAVDALDALAVGADDARSNAAANGLNATKVDFVKLPKKGKKDKKDKKSKQQPEPTPDDEDQG